MNSHLCSENPLLRFFQVGQGVAAGARVWPHLKHLPRDGIHRSGSFEPSDPYISIDSSRKHWATTPSMAGLSINPSLSWQGAQLTARRGRGELAPDLLEISALSRERSSRAPPGSIVGPAVKHPHWLPLEQLGPNREGAAV